MPAGPGCATRRLALGTPLRPTLSPLRPTLSLLLAALLALCPAVALAQDTIREEVKQAPQPKLTKPPQLTKFVPALYPKEAQDKGIQGTVELTLDLDATGKVVRADVVSSPDPQLSDAAVAAVKQFRFTPAEIDGKPGPVRVQYAYNFVLEIAFSPRLPEWMEDRQGLPKSKDPLVGRVREQGTRVPIPGAAVSIPDLGQEVTTDGQGAFAFKQVPPGKYKVQAISTNHKRETVEVEVREGEQSVITFYVTPLAVNPYETVVRGKRRKTVVTRVTLRQKELTTVPGTFGDPIRVVENMPGVARIPLVGGALIIRGAAPQDSGVFLDGTKIPQIYHFLGGPSVLNPQFLDRIDYYPGNADVRYGRLTAGVVDVHTRDTFTRQWGGSLDVNLLNTSALLKVPLTKRVSVSGAVRRSYIDAILPFVLKASDRDATTVVPVYYDYQLRVDVDLPGDDQLFFLAFGSDDALAVASNEEDEDFEIDLDSQIGFHRVLASWRWQISDRLVSKLTPTAGFNFITFEMQDAGATLTTVDFALREDLEYKLSRAVTIRGGLDAEVDWGELEADVPIPANYRNAGSGRTGFTDDVQSVSIDHWQLGIGAYVDALLTVTDRLQLIPGTRFELYRYFGNTKLSVEPRLTARYTLFPKTVLKAAAGMYAKAPDPQNANDVFGNSNLGLERAVHLSTGVEQQLLPALSLDAQLYYIRGYNMVVRTDQVRLTGTSAEPLRYTNQGAAYSYGMEVILKHDVTDRLYGWLAYTLSQSKNQREVGLDLQPAVFDQTHILTLVASVRLGWGWELGTRFRLVSGRPETPITGSYFDNDRYRYRRLLGEPGSVRLPLFHQLDLRVEKTWLFKLWRLGVYLDVQNVYNATNAEATLYDYRFRQSGELPGLPILPTLGIRGSF